MRRVAAIVTPPATTAVSTSEVKAHCRVTTSDEDTLLAIYLDSATSHIEQILQRKLITQTWKMYLDYWPSQIETLFGNLQSVTHVKYTDIDGTTATLSSSLYTVDTVSVPGRIVLKNGQSWPSVTLNAVNPIEVQFVTGYGAAAAVPQDVRNALLLTVGHLYENRENYVISERILPGVVEIPKTANALLQCHRVPRWCV
jgi:uncharacterized phiE125 gp8 family phage protein